MLNSSLQKRVTKRIITRHKYIYEKRKHYTCTRSRAHLAKWANAFARGAHAREEARKRENLWPPPPHGPVSGLPAVAHSQVRYRKSAATAAALTVCVRAQCRRRRPNDVGGHSRSGPPLSLSLIRTEWRRRASLKLMDYSSTARNAARLNEHREPVVGVGVAARGGNSLFRRHTCVAHIELATRDELLLSLCLLLSHTHTVFVSPPGSIYRGRFRLSSLVASVKRKGRFADWSTHGSYS